MFLSKNNSGAPAGNGGQASIPLAAIIETSQGNINVELFNSDAPKAVANFVKLAQQGFYDGLSFHRVIPGFMIQGGDPYCGRFDKLTAGKNGGKDSGICGTGGPGYQFEDELNPATASYEAGYKKGVLAMANSGPNTNGSQFFIMVADVSLSHNYTIFGRVTAGQEVAYGISTVPRNPSDRPLTPMVIKNVQIVE